MKKIGVLLVFVIFGVLLVVGGVFGATCSSNPCGSDLLENGMDTENCAIQCDSGNDCICISGDCESLTDGLVAYYPLDGNVNDVSTPAYNGANSGVSFSSGPNLFYKTGNQVGVFNEDDGDSISVSSMGGFLNSIEPFTISAWVKPDALDDSHYHAIVVKDSDDELNAGYPHIALEITRFNSLGVRVAGEIEIGAYTTDFKSNDWNHIVATFDNTLSGVDNLIFYVDGVEKKRDTGDFTSIPSGNLSNNLFIGQYTDQTPTGGGNGHWNGGIDEVKIWNRALSEEEVLAEYEWCGWKCESSGYNTCNDEDDRIMRLEDSENSLGALYNGNPTIYPYQVCYSDIFGEDYIDDYHGYIPSGGIHVCENNKIIGLDDAGYAQVPLRTSFTNPVCYGDLECRGTEYNCDNDEMIVVRLNGATDALISNQGDFDFIRKICCKHALVKETYWKDMMGGLLGEAQVGDTVKLVLTNAGIPGDSVTFEIKEDDWIVDDSVTTVTGLIDASGTAIVKWEHIPYDLSAYEFSVVGNPEFYFEAGGETSELLKVNEIEVNSDLSSEVELPERESIFLLSTNINLYHDSSDDDDDLQVLWDWNYGVSSEIGTDCLMNGDCTFQETYSETGTKMIRLGTNEMVSTRDNFKNYTSRVFVFEEGLNIFSIIDFPDYKDEYGYKSSGEYGFDGSRSYVVECIAFGTGCSTDYYNVEDSQSGGKLCCKRVVLELGDLTFEWKVLNRNDFAEVINPIVNEPSRYLLVNSGDYEVDLTVKYTPDGGTEQEDFSNVYLNIESSLWRCERGVDFSKWVMEGDERFTVEDGKVDYDDGEMSCYKSSESVESVCCPEGYICETADNDYHHFCIPTNANYCEDLGKEGTDLEREEECNKGYSPYMAIASVERVSESKCGMGDTWERTPGEYCYNKIKCSCVWEEMVVGDDNYVCKSKEENITSCGGIILSGPMNGECIWTLNGWEDNCDTNGYINASWDATPSVGGIYVGGEICVPKTKKIACESVEKLSFFSTTSLILTIISIITIYLVNPKFRR